MVKVGVFPSIKLTTTIIIIGAINDQISPSSTDNQQLPRENTGKAIILTCIKRDIYFSNSTITKILPAVFTLAVVLKVTTESDQNDNGGKSPANQHIDHAHVAVSADWSSTGEIERQSLHHHPGKGGHEQEVDESCHYFTSSLVVEKQQHTAHTKIR